MKKIENFKTSTDVVEKMLFLMGGECSRETDAKLREFKCARVVRTLSLLRNRFVDDVCDDLEWALGPLNRLMDECIDGCAKLFPKNVKWAYLRDLFVVPGVTDEEVYEAMAEGVITPDGFLCWPGMPWTWEDLTSSDEDFLRALYLKNGDSFMPSKLPTNAPEAVRKVHDFLAGARKAAMLVDCGKTDPFRFVSFLEALPDSDAAKLGPIRLFCDENASPTWKHVRRCVIVPVEYIDEPLTVEQCGKYASTGNLLLCAGDNTAALAARLPKKKTLALFTDPDLAKDIPNSVVLEDIAHSVASDVLKHEALGERMLMSINTIMDEKLETLLSEAIQVTGARLNDEEREKFLRGYAAIGPYPVP